MTGSPRFMLSHIAPSSLWLSGWQRFGLPSTSAQRRLRGGHPGSERLEEPGWKARWS